ncbi:hypothetical protein [Leucothrix arctica]|uniref:hypothetical protein n=1 Tax=Leucothrix arctica TaxID=1481894 RepID=UPI0011B2290A|nr:hypothetical protein [Leucothrix arctica]
MTSFVISEQDRPISRPRDIPAERLVRQDDTLLTVNVAESSNCKNKGVLLTEAQLLALPQYEFTTLHEWSAVAETFRGPLLEDILDLACKGATTFILKALNDYSVMIDFTELKQYKPIVAHSINGERLSVRDKGPLWVMVDHDKYNIHQKNLSALMIWQLFDITILSTDEAL